MTRKIWSSVVGVILLSAIGLLGAVAYTSTDEASASKNSRKLEGTWAVQVTLINCQTGDDIKTFPALLTFAQGGTLTETTAGFPPAARTPGHGVWKSTGPNSFACSSTAFLFGPDGVMTGKQTITQTIQFGADPAQFTSSATNLIVDPAGNTITTGCASAVATRVE